MRKVICLLAAVFMFGFLAIPTKAASEEICITLQPQSPCYPEYSVAVYTVKAEGTNLHAFWYMEWLGKTYAISEVGGAMQDWEPYAGEAYGARKIDNNTFAFVFEGIQYDLDGAYIWCVIEDGHYDVASQKVRISVGNANTPPEIVNIPSELNVEKDDLAEIRCVARSTDGSQLSFLWYETDSGKLADIRAVNRGEETCDFLICDTSAAGSRNYICAVSSSNGGLTYSSVVKVNVAEKQAITVDPGNSHEPPGESEKPEDPPKKDPAPETEDSEKKEEPEKVETVEKVDATPAKEKESRDEFPIWGVGLIAAAAAGIGFGAAVVWFKKKS